MVGILFFNGVGFSTVQLFVRKKLKSSEKNLMFKVLKRFSSARRGVFETIHGAIETPGFMNVATCAAIKGGLSSLDLLDVNCQVMLCNTYHLHLRPGDENIKKLGGLHKFTGWVGPILTDSGGFQVFSLAKLRKISTDGVCFCSHIDGKKIFFTPEKSVQIQSNLGSTIAMAFDECVKNPSPKEYAKDACARTVGWLKRCREEILKLNDKEDTINKKQLLFGINQGSVFDDLRVENMKEIADLDLDGYAIGGLAVGEEAEVMYHVIEVLNPFMPQNKIRYLMGVGTPINILESILRGVDLFDCVMPSRNARHGKLFTSMGTLNIFNAKNTLSEESIDKNCNCYTCKNFSRAYLHHLFKCKEILALRLAVIHNLYFYNNFFKEIRKSLDENTFLEFYKLNKEVLCRKL